MAWEMQQQMHSYITPSIDLHMGEMTEGEATKWLVDMLTDHGVESLPTLNMDYLLQQLTDCVINVATTTNGGFEFWVDPDGCTTIPWCSEDDMLEWWGY